MNKNNKSNISISVDTYSSIDSAIINKDIADKFSFSMYSLSSKKDNFDIFIRGLESLYTLTISRFYLAADNDSLVVEDADSNFKLFAVSSTANSVYDDISLYAKDPKTCEKIFNMLKPHLYKTSLELAIDMHEYFIDEAGKVSKSSSILNYSDLESFSSEFYPLLNTDELFSQYLISSEPILYICGEKGTGKSKLPNIFMKFLLTTEIDSSIKDTEWNTIKCCKVDNPDVLTKDNFWISLSKEKYQLIILDDIDKLIVSRENQVFDSATRDKFMNKFLSFSDGLSKTKSKVILTTNINSNDVDPAMTRKGRTFDAFRFRPLTKEQAKNIWESYAIESELFEKEFVGKEVIYQSDLGSKIEFITNLKKHNFFRQKYCLDPSISILEDIQKSSDLAL